MANQKTQERVSQFFRKFPNATTHQAAKELSIHRSTVVYMRKQLGISSPARVILTPAVIERMQEMRKAGASNAEIGRRFGVHSRTVYRRLREVGEYVIDKTQPVMPRPSLVNKFLMMRWV